MLTLTHPNDRLGSSQPKLLDWQTKARISRLKLEAPKARPWRQIHWQYIHKIRVSGFTPIFFCPFCWEPSKPKPPSDRLAAETLNQ